MAKLVTKFQYLKPTDRAGGYAKYIATREGVEKIDDTRKYGPATEKQKRLIAKIQKDFRTTMELPEFQNYITAPNVGNASAFLTRAIDEYADEICSAKTYADYIATRPRAQYFGSHGLFTDAGKTVRLGKVSEELNLYEGNVWTVILSLRREDAVRLGFDTGERWRDLLRGHTEDFSKAFHIPLPELKWYAAFHNEAHHPHVHLMVYSDKPKQGHLTKKGVEQLRSSLAREIFAQDLLSVCEAQTAQRDALRERCREQMKALTERIQTGESLPSVLEDKLRELSGRLVSTKGKKVYAFLKPGEKALVDEIVEELASDRHIAALYDLWYQQREEVIRTYTEELPERVPLWKNEAFRSIQNAVIKSALDLDAFFADVPEDSTLLEDDLPMEEVETSASSFGGKGSEMWTLYFQAKEMFLRDSAAYDPLKAVELLTRAATMGCGVAKYRLGKLYLYGKDVPQDVEQAVRWLEASIREEDNPFSEYLLGKALLKGDPTEQDTVRGEALLRRSAEQDNPYACYTLGKALVDGDLLPQNWKEGVSFLERSADMQFPNAEYIYGKLLYKGEVVAKDMERAIQYLEHASAMKNPYAAYLAGRIRLKEQAYRDAEKAITHFEIAAEAGNDYAAYQLGKLYFFGGEVPKDISKAMKYLHTAAGQGNPYAESFLRYICSGQVWSAATGTMRLLQDISRIFQEQMEMPQKLRIWNVDQKQRRIIIEKEAAHGIKQG